LQLQLRIAYWLICNPQSYPELKEGNSYHYHYMRMDLQYLIDKEAAGDVVTRQAYAHHEAS